MRIGYPCLNHTLDCRNNHSFKLASYSEDRLVETVAANLKCLEAILKFNVEHSLLFFRISSDLIPFASHPICKFNWGSYFSSNLSRIGSFIDRSGIRISMHPDQFTLLNSPDEGIVERSVRELEYHAEILDRMELDKAAKIQIHAGGVYGEREQALKRFVQRYEKLSSRLRKRLVIENDDRLYPLADCMDLHFQTGVPVLFDVFHHHILNFGEPVREALELAATTWTEQDGPPMVDYSSQFAGERNGRHAESLDEADFATFLENVKDIDCDVMLEIKDKEQSALRAVKIYNRGSSSDQTKAKS
jgi:UV DNA damage endonuclease